ncbi:MAG TPA: KAP family P-loop domain-containing protein [Cyanobacteria bacterium UBA8803]|nr:KAP family P-loop domain-containing protein [Cyanobacteria bacterium UBA9273]HBL60952.1 KAP family P-loop domain-containing protein [Cyanobacteria bacterium UBA8803]
MKLDLPKVYRACNPSQTLAVGNDRDRKYYIDFSSVRGGKIVEALGRTIRLLSPDEPTCQLFTGHIGCGKSTELMRLKAELEQQGFHVIYFESTQDLDMADVDISDILLAIARQVSESLESLQIKIGPKYFSELLKVSAEILQAPLESSSDSTLNLGIAKITAKAKENPNLRRRLREYLEPRTAVILESINAELLGRATEELKRRGKKGLVVIVDNLDRVDPRPLPSGRSQPEYLFIDRGEQLSKLNCHLVYTIPLGLIFSNEYQSLTNRLGGGVPPRVLPMIPVRLRDGSDCEEGMALLRQMVLARAFPDLDYTKRLDEVTEIFDSQETLDRLCRVSGGHLRNLLGLLFRCLQEEDPPLSRDCLERVIRESSNHLIKGITNYEWELLFQVVQQQSVRGELEYQTLLRGLFVFEYLDRQGSWFSINPILEETAKFQSWQQNNLIDG